MNPPADALAIIERGTKPGNDLLARLSAGEWVVGRALDAATRRRGGGVRVLLGLLRNPEVATRKEAVQRLSNLDPCPPEAVRGLVRSLADPVPEVRVWTAFLMGQTGNAAFMAGRFTGQPIDSEALEERIGRVAPTAVAGLVSRLAEEKHADVRGSIYRALRDLALWAAPAAPALRPLAARNPDAREALEAIEALHRGRPSELVRFVDGFDEKVSWMAGRVLVRAGRDLPREVVPLLVKRLTASPAAVEMAARLLGELGPVAAAAVPALTAATRHPDQRARNAAADAVRSVARGTATGTDRPSEAEIRRRLGKSAPPKLAGLVTRLLDDTSTGDQWRALWEIAQVGAAARPALPFVRGAMAKEWLRHDAAGALARLDPEAVRPMLPDLLRDFSTARLDGDFRERSLPFLAYLGPELQPDAVASLLQCLPGAGKRPRAAASMIPWAVGYLGSAAPDVLLPLVVRLLEARWEREGGDVLCPTTPVLKFLKQKGTPFAGAVPAVSAKLGNRALVPLALETLSRIGSWTAVLPAVDRLFEAKDSDVREAVGKCVRRLGETATSADVPALRAALTHRATVVQRAARAALDRLSASP